jgi:hypothetical protein
MFEQAGGEPRQFRFDLPNQAARDWHRVDRDPTTHLRGEDDLTKLIAELPSSRSDQGRGAQLESGARFGRDAPSERSIESEGPQACGNAIAQAHPRGCHGAGITLTADEQDD